MLSEEIEWFPGLKIQTWFRAKNIPGRKSEEYREEPWLLKLFTETKNNTNDSKYSKNEKKKWKYISKIILSAMTYRSSAKKLKHFSEELSGDKRELKMKIFHEKH